MMEKLKKKEIHVFNRFDQNLAFDVNEMLLFEISQLTKKNFHQCDLKKNYFEIDMVIYLFFKNQKNNAAKTKTGGTS